MKYYLIAGEASGDLHASKLMQEILKNDPNADFRFFGGDLMKSIGGTLVKHYRELAFMGPWEIIKNLNTIKANFTICKNDIKLWKPDVVIFIDYPAFNLKIAKMVKSLNIKTIYYISPKVWVWKKSRIKSIKKYIDRMYVIFPFEVDFYKKHNFNVKYLGNPTVDAVFESTSKFKDKLQFIEHHNIENKPIIALLPGSRIHEISKMLPTMTNVSKSFPNYQFVIAGMSSIGKQVYQKYTNSNLKIIFDDTFNLLKFSNSAIVTSGTATLETALLKIPQVVCYKTSKLSYSIGKLFINIKFFSLVNILMNKQVVVELLQNNLEADIIHELKNITENENYRSQMLSSYNELEKLLGKKGASERIVRDIFIEFKNK